MRKTLIGDGLKEYLGAEHRVWHMPGHKRKPILDKTGDIGSRLNGVMEYDVTEVPGTDDLYLPEGFIWESMNQMRDIYGTCGSYYVVNGATGGIFASIYACTSPGDTVIVARNCHKSVYNAVRVFNLVPVYAHPVWNVRDEHESNMQENQSYVDEQSITETGYRLDIQIDQSAMDARGLAVNGYSEDTILPGLIDGYIDPAEIEKLCIENPKASAIIVTSPTYDGVVSDISAISRIAKKYKKYLIVDEAHGAHLPFLAPQLSAISMGADLVVQSLHKTLPALTQTALLHVCTEALRKKTEESLATFLSSSPSYIMMMSMEQAICYAADHDGNDYIDRLRAFREKCKSLSFIRLLDPETVKEAGAYGYDETRLVFYADVPGPDLLEMLQKEGDVVCEMAGEKHVVLISTMVDTKEDFDCLYVALCNVDAKLAEEHADRETVLPMNEDSNRMKALNGKDCKKISNSTKEQVWRSRVGTRAEEPIYVYPPGSYIVEVGEIITEEAVEKILAYEAAGLRIRGK